MSKQVARESWRLARLGGFPPLELVEKPPQTIWTVWKLLIQNFIKNITNINAYVYATTPTYLYPL